MKSWGFTMGICHWQPENALERMVSSASQGAAPRCRIVRLRVGEQTTTPSTPRRSGTRRRGPVKHSYADQAGERWWHGRSSTPGAPARSMPLAPLSARPHRGFPGAPGKPAAPRSRLQSRTHPAGFEPVHSAWTSSSTVSTTGPPAGTCEREKRGATPGWMDPSETE